MASASATTPSPPSDVSPTLGSSWCSIVRAATCTALDAIRAASDSARSAPVCLSTSSIAALSALGARRACARRRAAGRRRVLPPRPERLQARARPGVRPRAEPAGAPLAAAARRRRTPTSTARLARVAGSIGSTCFSLAGVPVNARAPRATFRSRARRRALHGASATRRSQAIRRQRCLTRTP